MKIIVREGGSPEGRLAAKQRVRAKLAEKLKEMQEAGEAAPAEHALAAQKKGP